MSTCIAQKWIIELKDIQGRISGTHWPSAFTSGYVIFQILRDEEVHHHETTGSYPVSNYKIDINYSFELQVADDCTEIRISLVSNDIDLVTGSPKLIAKCGIFVEDMHFTRLLDKYFMMFRFDKLGCRPATGGYIRLAILNEAVSEENDLNIGQRIYQGISRLSNNTFDSYAPSDLSHIPLRPSAVPWSSGSQTPSTSLETGIRISSIGLESEIKSYRSIQMLKESSAVNGDVGNSSVYDKGGSVVNKKILNTGELINISGEGKSESMMLLSRDVGNQIICDNLRTTHQGYRGRSTSLLLGAFFGFTLGVSSTLAVMYLRGPRSKETVSSYKTLSAPALSSSSSLSDDSDF